MISGCNGFLPNDSLFLKFIKHESVKPTISHTHEDANLNIILLWEWNLSFRSQKQNKREEKKLK
jgi:hypothetical protein